MVNLNTLNPQQRLAAETIHGPVLILAGAGTGKTRVITFRIAHLMDKGVAPDNILGVTFTNKAAREMQERVSKLLPRAPRRRDPNAERPPRPTMCTFHSLCVRILREHIEKLGYKRNFVIYDTSDQLGAVRKILSHISTKGEKTDPSAILSLLSRYKNGGSRAAALDDPSLTALAEHIRKHYDSALRACNAVDFDDLILLTLRLFQEHPDALEACRAKYRYVMVDEYQDTNASQFKLVNLLTKEHRNLCVVGDDDQSIYGWRGAEISNLLDMEKHYPEVKVVKLEQNYRSTTTILQAANAIIKHNVRRRGKSLWSEKGQGEKIQLHTFSDDEVEARTVVEGIEFARVARHIPWSHQAILFRTNQQARVLETALRQGGVRYHLIGGQSYFDRREVKDFLAYLKVFMNPNDDISLLRIANVPARGLSEVTMERLLGASHERSVSVYSVMRNPLVTTTFMAPARKAIEAFVEFIERTRGMLHGGHCTSLQTWADAFLEETGYLNEVRHSEKTLEAGDNRVRNIKDLINILERTEAEPEGRGKGKGAETAALPGEGFHKTSSAAEKLQVFLEDLTLDSDRAEEKEVEGEFVTLITMHSCKGLEFPHVHIVGMEDGLLPHSRSILEGTMDEERRLFYVAITRAMESLNISHCATRKKYGQATTCMPSPFLKELPMELVELADEKAKQPVTVNTGKSLFDMMRSSLD